MKKVKKSYTAKIVFEEIALIRREYKGKLRSFREEIYKTMQMVQRVIVRLRKDGRLRRHFFKRLARVLAKRGQTDLGELNLSTEVVALTIGATSRTARKNAWKRGRVLDYLREHKVKVSDTARMIKKWGGIENIYAKSLEDKQTEQIGKDEENRTPRNGNDREMKVTIWMNYSDHDEIETQPVGTTFELSALRTGQKDGDLKITGVRKKF
jgi:hypothetical protein